MLKRYVFEKPKEFFKIIRKELIVLMKIRNDKLLVTCVMVISNFRRENSFNQKKYNMNPILYSF